MIKENFYIKDGGPVPVEENLELHKHCLINIVSVVECALFGTAEAHEP